MSTTTKGKKRSAKTTNKKEGFSAEEKAAMRARARELKDQADGESAVRAAIAGMAPKEPPPARALPVETASARAAASSSCSSPSTLSGTGI